MVHTLLWSVNETELFTVLHALGSIYGTLDVICDILQGDGRHGPHESHGGRHFVLEQPDHLLFAFFDGAQLCLGQIVQWIRAALLAEPVCQRPTNFSLF